VFCESKGCRSSKRLRVIEPERGGLARYASVWARSVQSGVTFQNGSRLVVIKQVLQSNKALKEWQKSIRELRGISDAEKGNQAKEMSSNYNRLG